MAKSTNTLSQILVQLSGAGQQEPWDMPIPAYAAEAGTFNFAGWVARLNSGRDSLEKDSEERKLSRVEAIKAMIDDLDSKIERNI